jgi:hypothetical protein
MARKTRDSRELSLTKSVANQITKLQSGFREIHSNITDTVKGGLGALGRGVLGDAQQLASDASEIAMLCAGRLSAQANEQGSEEWKDATLGALEMMMLSGFMVELAVACIAVRNRLAHHSHVPIILVFFSIATHLALFPHV